jgi:cyclic pyranopterin monophosphate synthase
MQDFSHLDDSGKVKMVDTSSKPESLRTAKASAIIRMQAETLSKMISRKASKKGDVLEVARLAGIMGAKQTPNLIPLCHSLPLQGVEVEFVHLDSERLLVEATVTTIGRTGVEMEALTAVSVAALTIYDMCKAIDRSMQIELIRLEEKSGGQHGDYVADHAKEKSR